MEKISIENVRSFWEKNPLFQGESKYKPGTLEFFQEHRRVYIEDCFAGKLDNRIFPTDMTGTVLDLGCGPGFWTVELARRGARDLIAADLTHNALSLARMRCHLMGIQSGFSQENAENLSFDNDVFAHVNCQGVIHHTPDTNRAVAEIARVLKKNGTAVISVYYKNLILRSWKKIAWFGKILNKSGAALAGRGREGIFAQSDVNEIVRIYDGIDNPLGKAYSKKEFYELLSPHFNVDELFYHFFPARSLPIPIPGMIHKWLDRHLPFMIFARLTKKN